MFDVLLVVKIELAVLAVVDDIVLLPTEILTVPVI
jgi:hypothetical protein